MKRILVVAGTRPEIIKLAPVVLEGKKRSAQGIEIDLCLTGQHQTMADEALVIFGVKPVANLGIMKPGQTLNDICAAVFERLPAVIREFRPDILMVQGDTTTAAMAAICAFNLKIQVAHVEAGLRSHNLDAPFPEELNRKLVGTLAAYSLCPTETARENLRKESVPESTLHVTGNTVVDALQFLIRTQNLDSPSAAAANLRSPYILVTAHRRESFGGGFQNICEAIRILAERFPGHQFVYPVHLNPNVQGPVRSLLGGGTNVLLVPPVPYLEMVSLLKHCSLVLTDSGGIQEEAPSFGKYAVVMRDVTERMESVLLGYSELVGADREKIVAAVARQIEQPTPVQPDNNPYGDGHASERILDILTRT